MCGFRRGAGILARWLVLLAIITAGLAACSSDLGALTGSAPAASPTAALPSPSPTPVPAGQTEPVPILMYHYIRPDPGSKDPVGQDLSVTPENFASQMNYLADHRFTTMTMADFAAVRAKRLTLPANPIVLTFDDGYRDFHTYVWPVLRAHHFKATSFVITGVVDQSRYLTWAMIDEMQQSGLIEFGAHTVTHRELPSLSDTEAKQEIVESQQTLESHLDRPVRSFAYPVGRYTERDVEILRSAGFDTAVTTKAGWAKPAQDPLELPRVRIHGSTTLSQFAANFE